MYVQNCMSICPLNLPISILQSPLLLFFILSLFYFRAPLTLWRTVWRVWLAYHIFGRFSDVSALTMADFSFPTEPRPHMTVRLRGGKTDCRNRGCTRFVSANHANSEYCLVSLTRQYFDRLGLQHAGFLVGRTQTGPNKILYIDGRHRLSYSTALKEFRMLLARIGRDPAEYAEHSAKRGAATSASKAGIDEPTMSRFAGWSTRTMAALYTDWPPSRHLEISDKLAL